MTTPVYHTNRDPNDPLTQQEFAAALREERESAVDDNKEIELKYGKLFLALFEAISVDGPALAIGDALAQIGQALDSIEGVFAGQTGEDILEVLGSVAELLELLTDEQLTQLGTALDIDVALFTGPSGLDAAGLQAEILTTLEEGGAPALETAIQGLIDVFSTELSGIEANITVIEESFG
jgi:hypothetical protein